MKKAAKDLQPGDVTPWVKGIATPSVIIATHRVGNSVQLFRAELGNTQSRVLESAVPEDAMYDVELRVDADDVEHLLNIAREFVAGGTPNVGERKNATDLINRLSPPNPPTYEELLDALKAMTEPPMPRVEGTPTTRDRACMLVDRARHAGVIK